MWNLQLVLVAARAFGEGMFCSRPGLRDKRLTRDAVNPENVSYVCASMEEFRLINEHVIRGGRLGVRRRYWIEARLVNHVTRELRALKGDETFAILNTAANPPVSPPAPVVAKTTPLEVPPPLPPETPKKRGRPKSKK